MRNFEFREILHFMFSCVLQHLNKFWRQLFHILNVSSLLFCLYVHVHVQFRSSDFILKRPVTTFLSVLKKDMFVFVNHRNATFQF